MSRRIILSWRENSESRSLSSRIINEQPLLVELMGKHQIKVGQEIYIGEMLDNPRGIPSFNTYTTKKTKVLNIDHNILELENPLPVAGQPRISTDIFQRNLPIAQEFMKEYNDNLYHEIIENSGKAELITGYGGVLFSTKIDFEFVDGVIHFTIPSGSVSYYQIIHNLTFRLIIGEGAPYYLDARAQHISEHENHVNITANVIKFAYGDQSNLETLIFERTISPKHILGQVWRFITYVFSISRISLFQIPLLPILLTISLIIGQGINPQPNRIFLIILGLAIIQSSAALLNDYFDFITKTDDITLHATPLTGGSQFIQNGLVKPENVLLSGTILLSLGIIIGIYITILTDSWFILLLGIFGAFLSYFYSASPIELVRRGLGEISLGLTFGPMVMIGTYFVLTAKLPSSSKFYFQAILLFLLITGLIFFNNFQDYEVDTVTGKKTSVVRLGLDTGKILVTILIFLPIILISLFVLLSLIEVTYLYLWLLVPLAIWLVRRINSGYSEISELLPASYALLVYYHLIGLILILLNLSV